MIVSLPQSVTIFQIIMAITITRSGDNPDIRLYMKTLRMQTTLAAFISARKKNSLKVSLWKYSTWLLNFPLVKIPVYFLMTWATRRYHIEECNYLNRRDTQCMGIRSPTKSPKSYKNIFGEFSCICFMTVYVLVIYHQHNATNKHINSSASPPKVTLVVCDFWTILFFCFPVLLLLLWLRLPFLNFFTCTLMTCREKL